MAASRFLSSSTSLLLLLEALDLIDLSPEMVFSSSAIFFLRASF